MELQKVVGRELKTEIDIFQAAEFATGTLTELPVNLATVTVPGITRLRLLNMEISNGEVGWVEIEFRDGTAVGTPRVLGPYTINGKSERRLGYQDLLGRYCDTAISIHIVTSHAPTPLTIGLKVNVSFLREALEPLT